MKNIDILNKTVDQLKDELIALKKEQFNMRCLQSTGQLDNISNKRKVRKNIARIKTLIKKNIKQNLKV